MLLGDLREHLTNLNEQQGFRHEKWRKGRALAAPQVYQTPHALHK